MPNSDGEEFLHASTLTDAMIARKSLVLCRQAANRTTPHFTAFERIAFDRLNAELTRREQLLWPNEPYDWLNESRERSW